MNTRVVSPPTFELVYISRSLVIWASQASTTLGMQGHCGRDLGPANLPRLGCEEKLPQPCEPAGMGEGDLSGNSPSDKGGARGVRKRRGECGRKNTGRLFGPAHHQEMQIPRVFF